MADDKFILMNLNDENSKSISEVLGNKTCKKILDYLGDVKEASEQDIAKSLKMPINTIEYNLKKLIKSGLVEKTKNFFWSVKGKKIPMYKLAKKHIVISTKRKPKIEALKTILPVFGLIIFGLLMVFLFTNNFSDKNINYEKLNKFNSQEELDGFLKANSEISYSKGIFGNILEISKTTLRGEGFTTGIESTSDSSFNGGDYSTTNIQVEGVDEADIVKNDGKYIYVVSNGNLKIINAYPSENMEILSEIDLDENINEIFINNNNLIVFANYYGVYNRIADTETTLVYIYDISDKENPELKYEYEAEGYYINSRMIENKVYVITSKSKNNPPVYMVNGIKEKTLANEVYYWDYYDYNYVFTSIISINIDNGDFDKQVYLTGASNNIYVSKENIYITRQKSFDYKSYSEDMIKEVYEPLLKNTEIEKEFNEIKNSENNYYEKIGKINNLVMEYSNSLKGNEKSNFDEKLDNLLDDYEIKIKKERDKSVIYKIGIKDLDYKGAGEVPGHVLNQFSMDEYNGNFRIATTTGFWNQESVNNLYVLNDDLEIIGKVEDLAKGERIYSARFIGDKAYIVTFKQVDPLYVIDVSDAENPKVLGYLKITGVSDYLHPYDENHLIGIGKDATEEGRFKGLKISLFDVSDFENPKEISNIYIGDRGTESEALYNHKAVLFNKEKNLLVIPVSLSEIKNSDNYIKRTWDGAYVFNIDLNGITKRGRISHFKEYEPEYGPAEDDAIGTIRDINEESWEKIDENQWIPKNYNRDYTFTNDYIDKQEGGIDYEGYLYNYENKITRSLYINNILYTISLGKIKANNLDDLKEISEIDLGYEPINYIYPHFN